MKIKDIPSLSTRQEAHHGVQSVQTLGQVQAWGTPPSMQSPEVSPGYMEMSPGSLQEGQGVGSPVKGPAMQSQMVVQVQQWLSQSSQNMPAPNTNANDVKDLT